MEQHKEAMCWLIFLNESGFASTLARKLESWGQDVTCVRVGESYRKIKEGTYTINPERREDYGALFEELCSLRKRPRKILHLWSLSAPSKAETEWSRLESSQTLGLHSLLFLAQALGERDIAADLEIDLIANNIHVVTGDEATCPEKATALGACKVVPLEYANVKCRAVDVVVPESGSKAEQRLIDQLLVEALTGSADPVVAYRGDYRWVETVEPARLEKTADVAPRLKPNGVYLITGGLGGVGLTLAEFLATSVRAKLVLVGRSPFPAKDQWDHWLDAHDETDEVGRRIRKLQRMEAAGAEVLVAAADVSDGERMREVVALAKKRFGRINGVIHSAGLADRGGIIQRRSKEVTEELLAAKVKGTLVLNELLAESSLDFFVLCSTYATVLYGPQFGQVGYVAANQFFDAFPDHKRATDGVYTVTINWPPWQEVGMAVESQKLRAAAGKREDVSVPSNSLSPPEGAEVFNRVLSYGLPRVVVSPQDLNDLLRRQDRGETAEARNLRDEAPCHQGARHPRPEMKSAVSPPRNETERLLAGVWQELLGMEEVGVYDNFFELGGESLLGTQLISRVRRAFDVELSLRTLYEASTVAAMAEIISRRQLDQAELEQLAVLSEMEELSEDEVEAELSRREQAGTGADQQ
jgi:NADP-dependent 3-hydroxy acid dehydrogenase YdfG